jgi:hypothetical protein
MIPCAVERGEPQLFVDDVLIASQENLVRTLLQPVKDNGGSFPVIAAPEGTSLLAYGSIVYDPRIDRYVMFIQEFPSRQMYRCLSADGLNWERDDGSLLEPITFNITVSPEPDTRGTPGFDLFSCIYDRDDADTPYKGWLYLANYGPRREGIYYVSSPDGVIWNCGPQVVDAFAGPDDPTRREIDQAGRTVYGPGDVTLFNRDDRTGRYLGLFKFFTTEAVPPGNHLRSRAYAFVDRLDAPFDAARIDRIALLPPVAATGGDHPYDEYYASTAWRYGPLWLGGLKIWHSKDDYPWSADGCAFLKLVVSRDGLHWSKVQFVNDDGISEVFIANGPEGGNGGRNDGGYISEFSQGPLRIGDELVYYYSASSFGKNQASDVRIRGGGIFRARLRVDGFVSVEGGSLITHPLKCDGERLYINAVGPVRVGMLDDDGAEIAFARIDDDSLQHEIRFNGESFKEATRAKLARLSFEVLPGGRLYSFTIE